MLGFFSVSFSDCQQVLEIKVLPNLSIALQYNSKHFWNAKVLLITWCTKLSFLRLHLLVFSTITTFIHSKSDEYNDKRQTWIKEIEKQTVNYEETTQWSVTEKSYTTVSCTSWKVQPKCFKFVVCNPCQSSSSLTILVPLWFIIISLVFFYRSKLLYWGFFQFWGNSRPGGQNNSKYND